MVGHVTGSVQTENAGGDFQLSRMMPDDKRLLYILSIPGIRVSIDMEAPQAVYIEEMGLMLGSVVLQSIPRFTTKRCPADAHCADTSLL